MIYSCFFVHLLASEVERSEGVVRSELEVKMGRGLSYWGILFSAEGAKWNGEVQGRLLNELEKLGMRDCTFEAVGCSGAESREVRGMGVRGRRVMIP